MPFTSENVIVPIDFSGESNAAIRTALQIAGDASKLHLLHVLVPIDDLSPGVLLGKISEETRTEHVRKKLAETATECGVEAAIQCVQLGSPGLRIADYANEHDAGLIVIPSHGYHGLKRLVLGSVTDRVIRHAHCSVLVLRRSDAQ